MVKWCSIIIVVYIMCIGMGIYIFVNEEYGYDGEKLVYYFVVYVFWFLVICICCVKIYILVKEFK